METMDVAVQLTNDLLKAVHVINVALAQVQAHQSLLKVKASKIKNHIQDDVSYHLELLRNREVWLMEQADVLLHLKEEAMESHQKELCTLLAKLDLLLQLIKDPEMEKNTQFAAEVNKVLSSIQNASLNVDESLDICFFVDNFALSDAIKEFGSITEENPSNTNHSVRTSRKKYQLKNQSQIDQDDVSFQEYFKAVWNSPASEWLVASSATVNENKLQGQVKSDGVGSFYAGIQQSDTKDWLYKENEPFNLKMITNSFTQHFEEVKKAPVTDWVQPNLVFPTSNKTIRFLPFDASEKLDSWLLTPKTVSQTTEGEGSTEDEMSSDCAKHSGGGHFEGSKAANMEIDYSHKDNTWLLKEKSIESDIGKLKINQERESESWLLPRSETQAGPKQQFMKSKNWLRKFRETMGKSNNDWLIVTGTEAKYCEWLTRESQERCKDCPGDCAMETFKVFRDISQSPRNQWLVTVADW